MDDDRRAAGVGDYLVPELFRLELLRAGNGGQHGKHDHQSSFLMVDFLVSSVNGEKNSIFVLLFSFRQEKSTFRNGH